jgi:hypothetical protein
MQIVETHDLISRGKISTSSEWSGACDQVRQAILATDWPHGTGSFTIYPESGKKSGQGNGVDLIRVPCIQKLRDLGWVTERLPPIKAGTLTTGDLDALLETKNGYIAFEWETGNISSSHRAINKLLHTVKVGGISGGFLVVPSNRLKVYLTDRIGNIGELRPYFPLWKATRITNGALRIVVVEHDATSADVPRIPKRTDGRALR